MSNPGTVGEAAFVGAHGFENRNGMRGAEERERGRTRVGAEFVERAEAREELHQVGPEPDKRVVGI